MLKHISITGVTVNERQISVSEVLSVYIDSKSFEIEAFLCYFFEVASRSPEERFFGGPRFGRSGAVVLNNNEIDRNPERFFIGSRYGKRSADSVERKDKSFFVFDIKSRIFKWI